LKKTNTHLAGKQQSDSAYESTQSISTHTINEIVNFLDCASGFTYTVNESNIQITQKEDSKVITFSLESVEKVLSRQDFDGSVFLQVNFYAGLKVLVTKHLVGFKPVELLGFDSQKIPKVVTTVDLKSVVKAIEDTYDEENYQTDVELEVLTKVYHSILLGAETVGFEMTAERNWYIRSMLNRKAATA
jgi:hypothetical protein